MNALLLHFGFDFLEDLGRNFGVEKGKKRYDQEGEPENEEEEDKQGNGEKADEAAKLAKEVS